jgi:hypothetical protein
MFVNFVYRAAPDGSLDLEQDIEQTFLDSPLTVA